MEGAAKEKGIEGNECGTTFFICAHQINFSFLTPYI